MGTAIRDGDYQLIASFSDLATSPVPSAPVYRRTLIPPLSALHAVKAAISTFRTRLPWPFLDCDTASAGFVVAPYDGHNDPWWIMLHANLYTAEMLVHNELARHSLDAYEFAVSCARALVKLVRRIDVEQWRCVGESIDQKG